MCIVKSKCLQGEKMIHGVRYIRQDVSYISKKHICPICGTSLSVIKVSKVINSNSEEAKEIPPIVPGTVIGNRGLKFRNYTAVGNRRSNIEYAAKNIKKLTAQYDSIYQEVLDKYAYETLLGEIDSELRDQVKESFLRSK